MKITGKVLLIGNFLSGSIANINVCEELADRLAKAGWNVITASHKVNRLSRLVHMATTAWLQRSYYDIAQIDVFSGPAFFWAETVCWVLRRARKPYVLTMHGGNLPAFSERWPGRVKRLLRSAAVVTSPSQFLREKMQHHRDDISLIPNALDIAMYGFRLRERPEPRLVWIRAFHDIYNPVLAPMVIARLIDEFPSIHLLMVGPDKEDGSFQKTLDIAAKLNVADRITVQKGIPKKDVPSWMNRGDIFINTSSVDNTPVSVIEAMACGLCVVSTNVGGLPYLLADNHDALLVPPNNPDMMADAVRRILVDPDLGKGLSRHAREKTDDFDWSIILPVWESLLKLHVNNV